MNKRYRIGSIIRVKRKDYKLYASPLKYKKYRAIPVNGRGQSFDFSHSDYTIEPGTKKAHNYCARSSGIKRKKKAYRTPNDFARKVWYCVGKKSIIKK